MHYNLLILFSTVFSKFFNDLQNSIHWFVLVLAHGLSWDNLTKNNFTNEHNMEILKAHSLDSQELLDKLLIKKKRMGITIGETIFNLHTRYFVFRTSTISNSFLQTK